MDNSRAWLMMAVDPDDRQFGGNDGYTDHPDVFYSWDSRVPHSRAVTVGDRVVLWDKHKSLGASVVEEIIQGVGPKTIYRCRECKKASIKRRKVKRPFFRCHNQDCKAEFDNPITETVEVQTYRSMHDGAWIPLHGVLSGGELRALCVDKESQQAIRPLDWLAFSKAISAIGGIDDLGLVNNRAEADKDGHRRSSTRVRLGQGAFRRKLLDAFGEVCALTGPCPEQALEAGHLYSYAEIGKHHNHGGLLLRRDVHTLFDRGRLAVDPKALTVDVAPSLMGYPMYAALNGQLLHVPVSAGHIRWLREHWAQHRPTPS